MPAAVPAFDAAAAMTDLTVAAEAIYTDEFGDLDETGDGDWREDPVDFETFVLSREHLNLPPLFELQLDAVTKLLGADPRRIFEAPNPAVEAARQYQLAVLLWGKGSGKDYLCSVIVCYLVYVLLCLRSPQRYFDLGPGEHIDLVNVAYNADQAKKVFFAKFKERLYRWRWLRENFDVIEGGRRKWPANRGKPQVHISDQDVLFPRNVRCFSRHSQNESYEGLNVLVWLMDEASAFLSAAKKENANAIYQTLRTSAGSRFGMRWLGFIISYPRHADDFTMTKCREARQHPEAGILGHGPHTTWEVNQMRGRDGFVTIAGIEVPVELANDFILDIEEARAKYMCQPPLAKDALIKDAERVWAAVRRGKAPMIEWDPIVTRRQAVDADGNEITRSFSAVKLTRLGPLPKGAKLFMHGDPARTSDAFGLGLAHGVPATVMVHVPAGEVLTVEQITKINAKILKDRIADGMTPDQVARLAHADGGLLTTMTIVPWERDVTKTVVDAVIAWRPDPRANQHVDLLNVKDVLQQLVNHYGVGAFGGVTFDQYDSAETVQWLEARKVPGVENEAWSNPFQHRIYRGARSAFYNDLVELPDDPVITSDAAAAPGAIYELLRVEEIEGHKIDHPEGGSKDLADVVVRLIEHVTGQLQRAFSFGVARATPQDQLQGASRRVDPRRAPSPVTEPLREADRARAKARPQGELEPSTATVIPARFSFGSARR